MRVLFILSLSLLMTACVPVWQQKPIEQNSEDVFWKSRYPELIALNNWEIKGRSVISQKSEGWNVGLVWQEFDGLFQVKLQGPFAQGGAVLKGDKNTVSLILDDGQRISSANPDALIKETLGIPLPLEALRDWVRGIPFAKEKYEKIEFDQQGRIVSLLQQGWQVDYKRYIPFKDYSMPGKIFIKKADQGLRIIILDWELTSKQQAIEWMGL